MERAKAGKVSPDQRFYETLGRAYHQQENTEQALANLEQAVAQGTDDPSVWAMLGEGHFATKNYQKAVAALNKAEPTAETHRKLATAYLELEQPEAALPHIEQAVAAGVADAPLYFYRGLLRLKKQQYRKCPC